MPRLRLSLPLMRVWVGGCSTDLFIPVHAWRPPGGLYRSSPRVRMVKLQGHGAGLSSSGKPVLGPAGCQGSPGSTGAGPAGCRGTVGRLIGRQGVAELSPL